MSKTQILIAIQDGKNVQGAAADAFRKAGLDLARRNPELSEAQRLIELELNRA